MPDTTPEPDRQQLQLDRLAADLADALDITPERALRALRRALEHQGVPLVAVHRG